MTAISSQSTSPSSRTPIQPRCPTYGGTKKRRVGFDQHALEAPWTRAPEPNTARVVVVVGVHDERLLVADEECGLAVARSLACLGQGQADAPQPLERIVLHASIVPTRPARWTCRARICEPGARRPSAECDP